MTPEEKLIVERLKATYADVEEMEKVFDIVTKALALREAEIEQLKAANTAFSNEVSLSEREIHRLKALLTRAADALKYMEVNWPNEKKGDYDPLIRQLRKAAE